MKNIEQATRLAQAEDEDYAADALSDEFGWCVSALNTEILED